MTAKQIAGYLKARRDQSKSTFGGISFNDGYNVPTYGITQADYYAIDRSMNDEYGMMASSNLTTAGVKKALGNHPISAKGPSVHHATKKSPAQLQREIDEALTRSPALTAGAISKLRRELVRELLARGEEPSAQYAEGLDDAEIVELARGRGSSFRDLTEMADAIETTGDARSHATKKSPTKGGMHPHAKGQRIMYEVSIGGATKELHPTKAKAIARAKTLAGKQPTAVFRVVLLPGDVISYHRPGASTSAIWHSD